MPSNASFFTFLNRSLRPTIIGMNVAFLAALGLGLVELPALMTNGAWSALPGAVCLLFVGAMLYALLFNLFFFLARVAAALVSHLDRFWPALVPGLVVFILLGEPAARFLISRFITAESAGALVLGITLVLFALGLCFLILQVFPLLRNINSSMMLFAALGARLLSLPVESLFAPNSAASFLIFELILLALGAGLYVLLQIRFLQHLAPLHDSPEVPDRARLPAWGLTAAMAGLLFYVTALRESPLTGLNLALYLPAACGVLFGLHWSLTALSLNRMRHARDPLPLLSDAEPRWFLGAVVILCAAALAFASSIFPNARAAREISRHGVVSHEVLTVIGFALDGDGDGNSRWPGGDPDDGDPCVRLDFRGRCPNKPDAAAVGETNLPRSKSQPRRGRILLTIAGKDFVPRDVRGLLAGMGHDARPWRLFLPGKEPRRALRAMFQDMNGLQERAGVTQTSIFTRYAAKGIRTLCGGYDGGRGYLSSANPARLDRGCQVHVPLSAEEKRPMLSRTTAAMLKKMRYYRESYSLAWIHHDFGEGRETKAGLGDMRELAGALNQLPEGTPATLVFMGAGKNTFAWTYTLGKARERTTDDDSATDDILSLREIMNAGGEDWIRLPKHPVQRIGTADTWRPAWTSALARALGDSRSFYTYSPRKGGVDSFDGITGAAW